MIVYMQKEGSSQVSSTNCPPSPGTDVVSQQGGSPYASSSMDTEHKNKNKQLGVVIPTTSSTPAIPNPNQRPIRACIPLNYVNN